MSATLGINVDHIATLREARKIREPDPVAAAMLAELAGADGITVHLREDRRHIQERDVRLLRQTVTTHLNLEMAATEETVKFAIQVLPDMVTLVPEKRQELTTEGGLNVAGQIDAISKVVEALRNHDIAVSLFVDPDTRQIKAARKSGSQMVELHTGPYATAYEMGEGSDFNNELTLLKDHSALAQNYGLLVNAGHGLNYRNVSQIAAIDGMGELNIGHSIIGRASLVGMERAVREMKELIRRASRS